MSRNENNHTSGIPQPSRLASPPRLAHLSQSAINTRSQPAVSYQNGKLRKTADPTGFAHDIPKIQRADAMYQKASTAGHAATISGSKLARPTSVQAFSQSVRAAHPPNTMKNPRTTSRVGHALSKSISSYEMQNLRREGESNQHPAISESQLSLCNSAISVSSVTQHEQQHDTANSDSKRTTFITARPVKRSGPSGGMSNLISRLERLSLTSRKHSGSSQDKNRPALNPSLDPELIAPSSLARSPKKKASQQSLSKSANSATHTDFDPAAKLTTLETMFSDVAKKVERSLDVSANDFNTTKEALAMARETLSVREAKIRELEMVRDQLTGTNSSLARDLESARASAAAATITFEETRRKHFSEVDDIQRQHRREIDEARRAASEQCRQLENGHADSLNILKRKAEDALDDERRKRQQAIEEVSSNELRTQRRLQDELEARNSTIASLNSQIDSLKQQNVAELEGLRQRHLLDTEALQQRHTLETELLNQSVDDWKSKVTKEHEIVQDLKAKLAESATLTTSVETQMQSLKARIAFLESDSKSQGQAFADLEQKTRDAMQIAEEAQAKLRAEETLRRKLHNQVQELKGNIRVFCRVRPTLGSEDDIEKAKINIPEGDEGAQDIEVSGAEEKSSLGTVTTRKHPFNFDRVFGPSSTNGEIFDEISQLVQSALDGFNVCIFCYGMTGSGKTYTMSSQDGMIGRATRQIYAQAQALEERGWQYTMEGSFVEVYNENINDLLGNADDYDKKKYEIHHDMARQKTTITNVNTVPLDSADTVDTILKRAMNNRSVAATKANERSSRSHSVFILTLKGENSITGEKSEGTLNLVDLAGSERLSHSGATGDRLKETQNINKSLACLGDVIGALGQGKEGAHIPYRNSKLTYLLQFSLGGNSKTLMFVMVSPMAAHLNETLTSLKFATKVHNTHIGTAKKQVR